MQQQHLMQMQPMMAAYYPNNYLDENKSLILKIVESQNSGKLSECAENQARLQRNLMYLAAIADSQPQPPTIHSQQYPVQPGAHYLQQHHQQAQQMTSQSLMAARSSMLYGAQAYPSLQQQAMHSQLGMTSGGSSGGGLMLQGEPHTAGGGGFPDFGRAMAGGSKQDNVEGRSGGGNDGGETHYLKSAEDGN
ncbi:hypothetical protein BUALT_Bualt06G0041800 [Buddleja alternifolia]|uniref:SS18 N-terminal domain-containing protein n=1 Tax=Buddleja alternifolia TaxID=168488 RepID=A0AAV6XJL5_9LAMI|nr:hypothetical protein BUALT_Bualt06G0041800 [Buddleja alternifolia]